jgi:ribosomal protein S1
VTVRPAAPCDRHHRAREGSGKGHEIAEIEMGAVVDGTVERITPYGAFLKLEDGRLGLVHISEIDRNYVKDVHEHLRRRGGHMQLAQELTRA